MLRGWMGTAARGWIMADTDEVAPTNLLGQLASLDPQERVQTAYYRFGMAGRYTSIRRDVGVRNLGLS
jgi:hypothetical protein